MTASVWLLAVGSLCGCGGGGNRVTGPDAVQTGWPRDTTLRLVSGATLEPVAGATLRTATDSYTSDGRGEVRLTREVALGGALTVETAAFLTRETLLRDTQATTFVLWPRVERAIGLDENYTKALVYQAFRLRRLPLTARRVSIMPSDELWADPVVLEAHTHAAERLTAVTGGRIEFVAEQRYGGGIPVTVELRPGACTQASDLGCAGIGVDHDYIIDGRIYLQYIGHAALMRTLVLHEMGHIIGLNHTPNVAFRHDDVMNEWSASYHPQDFSAREQLSVRLMLERRAGNRFPDDDAVLGFSTSALSGRWIVCGGVS